MTTPSNEQSLEGLVERVRQATGPDRELDGDLFFELDPEFPNFAMHMSSLPDPATFATGAYTSVKAPAYTASIDAALALVKRLRGDHWFGILMDAMRDFGAAGTLGPEHLPRFIILHLLTALKDASE